VRRAALLAGCLLHAACALPPAPEQTLCERPPQPAAAAGDPAVEASFRAFAEGWLERLRAASDREIGEAFETELRPTGDRAAPFIGVLRYCERRPGKRAVVTELFRLQGGEWVD